MSRAEKGKERSKKERKKDIRADEEFLRERKERRKRVGI